MEKEISDDTGAANVEHAGARANVAKNTEKLSKAFENPLSGLTKEELLANVDDFCRRFKLTDFRETFHKGALIAQDPDSRDNLPGLTEDERTVLEREHTHRWSQPFTLYWLCVMCSMAAAVQGMDETVNNGAQTLYLRQFGIQPDPSSGKQPLFSDQTTPYITGLIVGAPYLCCAVLGCWLTEPVNRVIGRRGTIFVSCFIAAVASIWEGVANTWVNLLIARLVLGLGIGPKSSTVPVYAAECAPAPIRGALVMRKLKLIYDS